MNSGRRIKGIIGLLILIACSLGGCSTLNRFQREGGISFSGLQEKVTVVRDEKGMAYIYAGNGDDALMAQGFVTAQDRLFQMELTRLFASGRLCELAGEEALALDIRMRTIGFYRQAKRHAQILDAPTKSKLERYIDGVNTYIREHKDTHPLEFKLSGITPQAWLVEDVLAIMYFLSWNSSANLKTEIIAQRLIEKLGPQKARDFFPLNINPDDPEKISRDNPGWGGESMGLELGGDPILTGFLETGSLSVGSNNWVVGPKASPGGKPILANDPHLDARILPGPFYPFGIIIPGMRFIGVGLPGTPTHLIGRNEYIAVGVTNSYGDNQDLYVETIDPRDPDRYLEGENSLPFQRIEETLKIRDKSSPQGLRSHKILIRATQRGPVVSGHLPGLSTSKVITLRWAPFETMGPTLGVDKIQMAQSVQEVRSALKEVNWLGLNYVMADVKGNIGWQTSGKLPIRSQGEGTIPFVVRDGKDNWTGWIPFEEMPQAFNPTRGWVGTCNHRTTTQDYPYYISSHCSPSYRYRRLGQLLDPPGQKAVDAHWQFQRDTLNLMAQKITPVMIKALKGYEDTKSLAEILDQWDFKDDPELAAPTVFQSVYRHFARLVFEGPLGPELAKVLLDNWYFWQERLQEAVLKESSPLFPQAKSGMESAPLENLFHQAAINALQELGPILGPDPAKWIWGKVHQLELVSPIRRKGFGKGLLGGGSHPMGGAGETLYRALYDFNQPFGVAISSALRMVIDLADEDKILAVLPGGVTARLFDPHTTDQIRPFMTGEKGYWWFSDKAIKEQARHILVLSPR